MLWLSFCGRSFVWNSFEVLRSSFQKNSLRKSCRFTNFLLFLFKPALFSFSLVRFFQYFRGNRDKNTVVMHSLRPDIEARVVRIHPVRWVNHISMRVEFYGRAAGRSSNKVWFAFFSLLRFLTCYGNVLKSFKLQNSKTKLYYGMMFRLKNARC